MVKPLAGNRVIIMTAQLPMLIQIGQAMTVIQNWEYNSGLIIQGEGRWMKEFKVMQVLTWENVWPMIEMTNEQTRQVKEIGGIYLDVEDWKKEQEAKMEDAEEETEESRQAFYEEALRTQINQIAMLDIPLEEIDLEILDEVAKLRIER